MGKFLEDANTEPVGKNPTFLTSAILLLLGLAVAGGAGAGAHYLSKAAEFTAAETPSADDLEKMKKHAAGPALVAEVEKNASEFCYNLVPLRTNQFATRYLRPSAYFVPETKVFKSIGIYELHPGDGQSPGTYKTLKSPLTYDTLSSTVAGGMYTCDIKVSPDLATWQVLSVTKTNDFPAGMAATERTRVYAERLHEIRPSFPKGVKHMIEISWQPWNSTPRP